MNRLGAHAYAAAGRIHFEDDDLDVRSNGERPGDVAFPGHAGFTQRHQPRASRREEDEHAKLFMTLDLSGEPRPGMDLGLRRNGAAGAGRAVGNERDADALLLEIDAEDLEGPDHADRHRARPSIGATCWRKRRGM